MTQTIDFVREKLKGAKGSCRLSAVCSDLCDACCAETADGDGTGLDNVTVIIVALNTAGAAELLGTSGGSSGGSSGEEAFVHAGVGEGLGEMDCSDDGKRKQEEEGDGRGVKQMRGARAGNGGGEGE